MGEYICAVCDVRSKPRIAINDNEADEWMLHHVNLKEGVLVILTCPDCATLNLHQIFEGYKARIRSGKDLNYH